MLFIHRRFLTARFALILVLLVGSFGAVPAQAQSIVYRVAADGAGSGLCGADWANPCDLQYALTTLASTGDEIWVKQGIYKPGNDRSASFILRDGIALYGGFAGTESARAQRDPAGNVTVLSGDLNGDDNNNIAPDEATRAENVFHVVSSADTETATVLDGFTITGGNASLDYGAFTSRGGGMLNIRSNPTLENLIFTRNSALMAGGGVSNENQSHPNMTNIQFTYNASEAGAGLSNHSSSPTLTQVLFSDNAATLSGGGAANFNGSAPTYLDVTFVGNTSGSFGGGISTYDSEPRILRSTFHNNHALFNADAGPGGGQGGAMYNSSSLTWVENTTFVGNTAANGGSGVANLNSNPAFLHVTFTGNWDAIRNTSSSPGMTNSIIWGNIHPPTGQVFTITNDANSSAAVSNSVIQNGYPSGSNIITTDPMLGLLGDYGGYTQTIPLLSGSSAIDQANADYCPATDQRGFTRPQGSGCDMGAYEYDAGQIPTVTISGNAGVAGVTLSYTDGTLRWVVSDRMGDYSFQVPENWSGTVTPYKEAYTFSPASYTYTNITSDQLNQDYVATSVPITITGNTGVGGVTLSYFDEIEKTVISDNAGNYFFSVLYPWSGTVTPSKAGYRFTPVNRTYNSPPIDQLNQDYTAERVYTISGNAGIAGVTISYADGTPKWVLTDNLGNYSFQVPEHWSGTVTPSRSGYVFSPANRVYSDVQSDQSDQNYLATALYTISGNAGVKGATLSYVEDSVQKSVTVDTNGNYSFIVKAGWNGTVTPSKAGVTFAPASKTYTNVQSNQTSQNYVASIWVSTTLDSGSGSLRQALSDSLNGSKIRFVSALAGQTITLSSTLRADKSVTIDGSGLNPRVAVSGNDAVRIFHLGDFGTSITLQSLILKDGYVTGVGGRGAAVLATSSQLTIRDVLFSGNFAYDGGAIYSDLNNVNLQIAESEFDSNSAQNMGGALFMRNGFLTVQTSRFQNNTAGSVGGALNLEMDDQYVIENNTFTGNSAVSGGAIRLYFAEKPVYVRGNTFIGNTASNVGGAIFETAAYTGFLNLVNNTFYANQANQGGAVIASDAEIKNNTFSHNKATQSSVDSGASLYLWSPMDIKLYNNILANNTGGGECYSAGSGVTQLNGNNNLIEDGSPKCMPTITGDPALGSLGDNGGPTYTMSLSPESPAINAGDSANCPATDQRGIARPQGSGCDIGAFEYIPLPTATPTNTPTATQTPTATATPPYSYHPLLLSLTSSQTVGGVASADEDILRFDGQTWSLAFDGSDVGVGSPDLFGFSFLDADSILMSFSANVTVNGITATPQDVLRFDATSLGSTTAGTWSLYFDGSDVGLDSSSEAIDSLTLLSDGRLLISTTGNPSIAGLSGASDEDVLAFTPTTLGSNTSGSWSLYFDGSDVGLADTNNEDVDALDVTPNGRIYLSTLGDFAVNGVSGADEDVFVCVPASTGSTTICNYLPTLYFDGSTWGLSGNDVDAFNFLVVTPPSTPPSVTPHTPTPTATASPSPTPTFTRTATSTPTMTATPPASMFLRVLQPNGGETLNVGSVYRITWDSTSDIDTVTIGYKGCDSCLSWIANNIANTGYYDWTVSVGNTLNTQFKIYIIGYDTGVGSISDVSDNNFTVLPPPTVTPTFTATPTATQTPPVTATPSTSTFTAIADAYVNSGSPTSNYGSSTTLRADASPDLHSYLRFNVQGLNGTVTKATLRLFANSALSLGCTAHSVSNNTWTESTINYNNAPPVGGALGSSGSFGAGVWISMDVTAYITGNGTYNLALTTPSSTAVSLVSREAGANPPQLIIETSP